MLWFGTQDFEVEFQGLLNFDACALEKKGVVCKMRPPPIIAAIVATVAVT